MLTRYWVYRAGQVQFSVLDLEGKFNDVNSAVFLFVFFASALCRQGSWCL